MDRKIYKALSLFVCCVLLLSSCDKNGNKGAQPSEPGTTPPPTQVGERNVYVACEGSFGNGNASLYMQNLSGFTVYDNVYLSVNGEPLGDVFQSIQRIGDKLFLCINNSDKVTVIDANTRKYIGEMSIPKPRYVLPISDDKAYVSTLYSNKVYVVNPQSLAIKGTIEMPAQNPEGMLLRNNRVYVCTWDVNCDKVYIINPSADQVTDSYKIAGYAPQQVVADKVGAIWVLAGNVEKDKPATLTRLVPGGADILKSWQFADKRDVIKPVMNSAGDMLYFIGVDYRGATGYNGVYRMSITDGDLPSTPFVSAQKFQYYWGLGIDPKTDEIYIGDPKGFTQKGSVAVYSASGERKRTFEVGVGPGYFYFDE